MTAEIICVGTELLLGDILNTNARFLSRELAALGIDVLRQQVVGDNAARLESEVRAAMGRSDLLVFSGGLGPTADDLTKETVARCFGDEMRFEPRVMEDIRAFFTATGRTTPANNEKQAMVPAKGGWFENPNGTAPAVWFEADGKRAVLLPGPPGELEPLWKNAVRPFLQQGQQRVLESLVLRLTGIGESHVEELLGHLFGNENPTAAVYAKTAELTIRITAAAPDEERARAMCREYAQNFYRLAGEYIYAEGEEGLEYALVDALRQKGLTLATAESCTGGLVSQLVTNVPGASEVFGFGFVTYANEAKQKLLGVSAAALEQHGAVSHQVAAAMGLTAVAALAYLMFNLYTPPCFAAIGAMNSEMQNKKWLFGGIALQLGTGYTLSFLVYQVGTLVTTGSVGTGFVPGLIAVVGMAGIVTALILRTQRHMAQSYALSGGRKGKVTA